MWRCPLDRLGDTIRGELGRFGPEADIGSLIARWPAAVGEAIARNAWPARIARDGTVHINTADAIWAFELTQRSSDIARRLEVAAVRFAPGLLATSVEAADRPPPLCPTPEQLREAEGIASVIEGENLRKAVEKAVSLSLARGCADLGV